MKKLIAVALILALLLPAFALAEPDPIVGAWYVMFNYDDIPYTADVGGREYMLYILFFEDDGTVSGATIEALEDNTFSANASVIGKWSSKNGVYNVSIIGMGESTAELKEDRLIIAAYESVYYSMQRINWSSWYTDLIVKPTV